MQTDGAQLPAINNNGNDNDDDDVLCLVVLIPLTTSSCHWRERQRILTRQVLQFHNIRCRSRQWRLDVVSSIKTSCANAWRVAKLRTDKINTERLASDRTAVVVVVVVVSAAAGSVEQARGNVKCDAQRLTHVVLASLVL